MNKWIYGWICENVLNSFVKYKWNFFRPCIAFKFFSQASFLLPNSNAYWHNDKKTGLIHCTMNDVLFVLLRFPMISLFRYMFFTMRNISFDLNPAHEVIVLCCINVKSTLGCVFQYALLYSFRLLHLLSLPASGKLVTPYSDSSTIPNRFIFNEFCVRTSLVDFSFPLAQCCISCYVSRGFSS